MARSVLSLDLFATLPVRAPDGNPICVHREHPAESLHVMSVPAGFKSQREGVILLFGRFVAHAKSIGAGHLFSLLSAERSLS